MSYLTYIPKTPISEFVDYFWLFDGGQTPRKERIVPSGTTELVVNLRDDEIHIQKCGQSKAAPALFRRRYVGTLFEHICSRRNAT